MQDQAVAYLAGLQKEAFKRAGMHLRPTKDRTNAAVSMLPDLMSGWGVNSEELTARMATALTERVTEFEDPGNVMILRELKERIASALPESGAAFSQCLLGSLPIGRMNAAAIYHPASEQFIIVFQTGLFRFLNLFCKVIVQALPFRVHDGYEAIDMSLTAVEQKIESTPHLVRRFIDLLDAYVIDGDATHALPYLRPTEREPLVQQLLAMCETFVLGHEYGHVCLGHLNDENLSALAVPGESAQQVCTTHMQEFAADAFGLDVVLQSFGERENPVSISTAYFGVEIFFAAAELIDRSLQILEVEGGESSRAVETHPAVSSRRKELRDLIQSRYKDIGAGVASAGAVLDQLLSVLWRSAEHHFKELRKKEVRPHIAWSPLIDIAKSEIRSQIPWRCVQSVLEGIQAPESDAFPFYAEYGEVFADFIAVTLIENASSRTDEIGDYCRERLGALETGLDKQASALTYLMDLPDMKRVEDKPFLATVVRATNAIKRRCAVLDPVASNSSRPSGTLDSRASEQSGIDELANLKALGSMVFNLRSTSPVVRKATAEYIAVLPADSLIAQLMMLLVHPNPPMRVLSANILLSIDPHFEQERAGVEQDLRAAGGDRAALLRFHRHAVEALAATVKESMALNA